MNFEIPDSTYKLLVTLGIILMAYFYQDEISLRNKSYAYEETLLEGWKDVEIEYAKTQSLIMWQSKNASIIDNELNAFMNKLKDTTFLNKKRREVEGDIAGKKFIDSLKGINGQMKEKISEIDSTYNENKLKAEIYFINTEMNNKIIDRIRQDIERDRYFELLGLLIFLVGLYHWLENERR